MSEIQGLSTDSSSLKLDYLNLLVSQLKYQNPLEPVSNTEFTAQLAQLSQLEQLENLNSSFAKVLAGQQLSQASGLVGKTVTFVPPDQTAPVSGRVEAAEFADGQVLFVVGQNQLTIDDILSVSS